MMLTDITHKGFKLRTSDRTHLGISKNMNFAVQLYAKSKNLSVAEATDRIIKVGLWWLMTHDKQK